MKTRRSVTCAAPRRRGSPEPLAVIPEIFIAGNEILAPVAELVEDRLFKSTHGGLHSPRLVDGDPVEVVADLAVELAGLGNRYGFSSGASRARQRRRPNRRLSAARRSSKDAIDRKRLDGPGSPSISHSTRRCQAIAPAVPPSYLRA